MRIVTVCLLLLATMISPALAGEANAELKARAETLIARSDHHTGIWTAVDDGSVRHVQSGMICVPGWPPRMPLTDLLVLPSPYGEGMDVACDYPSLIDSGKITVYATRTEGLSLEESFKATRIGILALHKDAVSKGTFGDVQSPGTKWPTDAAEGMRSEIFTFNDREGTPVYSYVLLKPVGKWTVEVRMTVPQREVDKDMISRIFALAALHTATDAIAKQSGEVAPAAAP